MAPITKIILTIGAVGLGAAGVWFVADKQNDAPVAYKDLIEITSPQPNEEITSPLVVRGQARGNWYFEATFPIVLVDWDGRIIAESFAQAQGEWMKEEYVPFEGKLVFNGPTDAGPQSLLGTLILRKDNPSGLPEHDDAFEIPVRFDKVESDDSGILPFNSGVSGIVSLGPTCHVMQYPPDPDCNDKPFETTVQVFAKNSASTAPFAVTRTDKEGRYSFALPPGGYTLQAVSGKPFPSCGAQSITIEPEVAIEVNLSCDTGIR